MSNASKMVYRGKLLIMICLGACGPRPGVAVARDGDGYVLNIFNCAMGGKLIVTYIKISKGDVNNDAGEQCELVAHGEDRTLERWRYGVESAGFKLSRCLPLERETTYNVHVGARPWAAVGHFSVDGHGDVKMIDGDCR